MSGGAQGFVSDLRSGTIFFPWPAILADRDDRGRVAFEDRGIAVSRVIGAIGDHGADVFVRGELTQQAWIERADNVAAGGEFNETDVRSGSIYRKMKPAPLAPPLNAVHAGLPLTIAKELDPSAIQKQVQPPVGAATWDLDGKRFLSAA